MAGPSAVVVHWAQVLIGSVARECKQVADAGAALVGCSTRTLGVQRGERLMKPGTESF